MLNPDIIPGHIHRETIVPVDRTAVWCAWTDPTELARWFGREARVELRPGGPYEILFMMDNPPGLQGGEGNTVQSYEPGRFLAFTWNAPPQFGPLRDERTWVRIELEDTDEGTRVTLTHYGWRDGEDWAAVRAYFENAWNMVMAALQEHFGPPNGS
jgi:uncharacterized protein YndB with AHSA1/START domain